MPFPPEQWDALLTTGGGNFASQPQSHADLIGARLGAFEIIELIGVGGMACVYLAARRDQFEQRVAIKVLHADLKDPAGPHRFLRERQILADLEHPRIARILDGGLTEAGQPYLVMEYVAGRSLDQYLKNSNLGWRQRLSLLLDVVDAVAAAHRCLVVHCDLKPGNILVSDDGTPKLLDFGIASAAAREEPSGEQRLYTPLCAAPEQLKGHAVSAATDIYQLGLLLYQSLTGVHPLDAFREDLPALRDAILKGAWQPLSGCLARLKAAPPRYILGDLDAVVARCLALTPNQRYETVASLRADLRAILDDRTVRARRAFWPYRVRRGLRRHRYVFATAGLGLAMTVSLSIWYWNRLSEETERADQADAVSAFVAGLLDAVDPLASGGRDLTEVISVSGFEPGAIRAAHPAVQRELVQLSGRTLMHLGRFQQVIEMLRPLVEELAAQPLPRPPRYAEYLSLLGYGEYRHGDPLAGQAHLRQALEALDAQSEPAVVVRAVTLQRLGLVERGLGNPEVALGLVQQALDLLNAHADARPEDVASAWGHMGLVLTDLRRFDAAVIALERAIAQYRAANNDIQAAMNLGNLSDVKRLMGHPQEAEQHAEAAVVVAQQYARANPQLLASALISRGNAILATRRWGQAASDYRQARDIYLEQLGLDHPRVGRVSHNLATALRLSGQCSDALPLYDDAIRIATLVLPENHPDVLASRRDRAQCL